MLQDTYALPEIQGRSETWCYDGVMAVASKPMQQRTARLGPGGELSIPPELREQLGWEEGTALLLTPEAGGTLRLTAARSRSGPETDVARSEEWIAAVRAVEGMWQDREDLPKPDDPREHRNPKRPRAI